MHETIADQGLSSSFAHPARRLRVRAWVITATLATAVCQTGLGPAAEAHDRTVAQAPTQGQANPTNEGPGGLSNPATDPRTNPPPAPLPPLPPAAPPADAPAPTVLLVAPPEQHQPITEKWWFWTGAAAAVGVVITVVVVSSRPSDPPNTRLGNMEAKW